MTPQRRILLVLLIAVVYALCYVTIKAGLPLAPPLRFAGLRAAVAGAALLLLLAASHKSLLPTPQRWPGILLLAALSAATYGAMFLSPGRTGAGIASVLGNTTPLFAILLGAAALRERVTQAKLIALVLGFAGVSLIAYPAITRPSGAGLLGAVLPLLVAVGSATESIVIKRLDVGSDILRVAGWQLLLGGLSLLALSTWIERDASILWGTRFAALLAFLALVGTAFTTALWYWILQRDEVGRLTLYLFLVPVLGLGLAAALYGERLGAIEWTGVAVTLLGLGWITADSRREYARGIDATRINVANHRLGVPSRTLTARESTANGDST
ncbi:MAG: DMT family transporter [Gemmatimonadaceae bacterium]